MIYLESIFEKPTKSYLFDAVKHWWALPFTTYNQLDDNEECCVLSKSVREFAFSTIPKDSQEEFHLTIGRNLWSGLVERDSLDDFPEHQSLIVTQMLLGENGITDPNERTATASLCLSIAKEAIAMSQFSSAAKFLDKGIHLLSDWCWREEYDLTIALYNISAEVSYILGDFETVQRQCHAIFHNAQLVDHTFPACSVQISILSAAGNTDEALRVGLDVLEKIGESIVARPSKLQIARSFLQLRRLSRNITPNKMRQLPLMSNPRKAAAMLIINHMIMPAHFGRECLTFFLMNRLIHLTVQHGLCNVSSVAFGWFAVILATTGQTRLSSQFAELALDLLHRFESKQWLSRVHLCVFGGVFGWTQNIRNALVPLSRGFEVGIETGDIEVSRPRWGFGLKSMLI
jgi:predicted ATPase